MTHLSLQLFGPGALAIGGRSIRPHSAKARALLAYLVVESDRPHPRARLAELLWGGTGSEASSRQSLRQALYSLRTLEGGLLQDCLPTDQDVVRFVPHDVVRVDLLRFVACSRSSEPALWHEAAALYRAPLLDGTAFDDCAAFTEWLDGARARLHALAEHNLDRLVVDCLSRSKWDDALACAQALRDLDPTNEGAARHLMRIHGERHRPHALEAEWSRLCAVLRREFGVAPSGASHALYRSLHPAGGHGGASAGIVGTGAFREPRRAGEADAFVRAARAAEAVYAFGNAVDLYDRAIAVLRTADPDAAERLLAVLLRKEAALQRVGRRADQVATVDQALRIAEALDDPAHLASVLLRRAGACAYLGNGDSAVAAGRQALRIYRDLQDRPGEAEALRELGFVHWRAEQYGDALSCAREALELHRRLGDVAGEASALHNLAEIHRGLGSPAQAVAWYERAQQLHWAAGNHDGEILTLFGMASALQQAGDLPGSRRSYEAALASSVRRGERTMQARALHALAMQHCGQQQLDVALDLLERAVAIDRSIGYAHALGHDLVDLSLIRLLRGERSQARATLQEALVWFTCTDDHDAAAAARDRLDALDAGSAAAAVPTARSRVKSHLPLAEGKVYCEFESPLAVLRSV